MKTDTVDETNVTNSFTNVSTVAEIEMPSMMKKETCSKGLVNSYHFDLLLYKIIVGPIRSFHRWKWREATNIKTCSDKTVDGSSALATAAMPIFGDFVNTSRANNFTNSNDIKNCEKASMCLADSASAFKDESVTNFLTTVETSARTGLDCFLPDGSSHVKGSSSQIFFFTTLDKYTSPITNQGPKHFVSDTQASVSSLCIIMVGLPARGKTFLAQKICRLLGWHGFRSKLLNVQMAWKRLLLEHKKYPYMPTFPFSRRNLKSSLLSTGSASQVKSTSEACFVHETFSNTSESVGNAFSSELLSRLDSSHVSEREIPEKLSYVSAENFSALVNNPDSVERQLYRHILQEYAEHAKNFYACGGDVLVVNDDFVTEELRDEAEAFFSPLASETFFVEVICSDKLSRKFYELRMRDTLEYPDDVDVTEATDDFARRIESLKRAYTTLSVSDSFGLEGCGKVRENITETEHIRFKTGNVLGRDVGWDCTTGNNSGKNKSNCSYSNCHNCHSSNNNNTKNGDKPYVRLLDSEEIEVHGVTGYMGSRIVSYLMNLTQHKVRRPIYFVRQGESLYDLEDRIGGVSTLTDNGKKGASELLCFLASLKQHYVTEASNTEGFEGCDEGYAGDGNFHSAVDPQDVVEVWTSQSPCAMQTVEGCNSLIGVTPLMWSNLNAIDAGVCENFTQAEVRTKYPLISEFYGSNKYAFGYPKGESYQDLINRLEPVIMELDNTDRVVVVVADQSVIRALLAYFAGVSAESCVWMEVPHRTVWRCTYDSKGIALFEEMRFEEQ